MGKNQAEFGALGGVVTNSQSRYESGQTEPSASYLANLANQGVDVVWILTGQRGSDRLTPEQSLLLDATDALTPEVRHAVVRLACTITGRMPQVEPVYLPDEEDLAQMFEGLLAATDRGQGQAERARELAELLPTGLSALRSLQERSRQAPATEGAEAARVGADRQR